MSDLGSALGLGIAFVGGVVSFASPCCLPLVPAYVSYMVGATGEGTTGRRPALTHGLAFVAGFSIVFVAFYALIGALGVFLDRRVMNTIGGALLIVLGLQVAGLINVRALWRDTRAMPAMGGGSMGGGLVMVGAGGSGTMTGSASAVSPGYGRSFVFGLLFAAGWSPCIGPILGGILGLATATASVALGTSLLIAYAAGLAIPFLAVAMGASWVSSRLTWVGRHHALVSTITGVMLMVIGRAHAHQHARPAGDPRVAAGPVGGRRRWPTRSALRRLQPAAVASGQAAASPSLMDRVDAGLEGLWHLLTSMRVAMILMIAIAVLGVIGSLVIQAPVGC